MARPLLRGNSGTTRAINRRLIINHLRRFGPTSRSELVEVTGLSPAAVTFVTAGLIQEGFVVESGLSGSRLRPLDINYSAHFAVGLKLMQHRLCAVLTDFSTRIVSSLTVPLRRPDPLTVADTAAAVTGNLIRDTNVRRAGLAGIGLAFPGIIDIANGVCVQSHRLNWTDVPIASMIAERAKVPVWADNDVNAFAVAEHLFGHGRKASSLIAVTIGRGVGAGIVLNGQLYHGRHGAAGEFGHIPLVENGRNCECGRKGCLEAYVSEPALVNELRTAERRRKRITAEEMARLGTAGDAAVVKILGRAGRLLGRGLASLVNLFDPEILVIGGEGVRFGEPLFAPMRSELDRLSMTPAATVAIDVWDDDAWARGAAGLAIQRFFDFEAAGAASHYRPAQGKTNNRPKLVYSPT